VLQDVWSAKLPWVEFVVAKVHKIRCQVCTKIVGKEKLLDLKLGNLWKHGGNRKALVAILGNFCVGEYYMNK
jgi:hypothetical protein